MLFSAFQDSYTNDQYHELTDPENLTYEIRSENSIFFEVIVSVIYICTSGQVIFMRVHVLHKSTNYWSLIESIKALVPLVGRQSLPCKFLPHLELPIPCDI